MSKQITILERAISDVGIWSWWTGNLPEFLQLEFSGVQLWNPPLSKDKPPSGQIALRFDGCECCVFMSRDKKVSMQWPSLIANEKMNGFTISSGEFALASKALLPEFAKSAVRVDLKIGKDFRRFDWNKAKAAIGFWSGPVGILVGARKMTILSHSGKVPLSSVAQKRKKWWSYWKKYWKAKDTTRAMPRDYACEVTIPAGS